MDEKKNSHFQSIELLIVSERKKFSLPINRIIDCK